MNKQQIKNHKDKASQFVQVADQNEAMLREMLLRMGHEPTLVIASIIAERTEKARLEGTVESSLEQIIMSAAYVGLCATMAKIYQSSIEEIEEANQ